MRLLPVVVLAALAVGAGCRVNRPPPTEEDERRDEKRRLVGGQPPMAPKPDPTEFDLKPLVEMVAADLDAAAKAMKARADAYGYKGVEAAAIQDPSSPRVRLSCSTGLTSDMRKTLGLMAKIGGKRVELRLPYYQSKAEREQRLYDPGKNTAPDSAKWYQPLSLGDSDFGSYPRLLLNEPSIAMAKVIGPDQYTGSWLVFAGTDAHQWKFASVLVDGAILQEPAEPDFRRGALEVQLKDREGFIVHCLAHPMPGALTQIR